LAVGFAHRLLEPVKGPLHGCRITLKDIEYYYNLRTIFKFTLPGKRA
jgi:hypothetical protein